LPRLNDNSTIWRDIDIGKYLDMITTQKLFFANPVNFEDPYELVLPDYRKNKKYAAKIDKLLGKFMNTPKYRKMKSENWLVDIVCSCTFAYYSYVNCWHINEIESSAMWERYSKRNYGIAIKSKYGNLKKSLNNVRPKIVFQPVRYFDFDFDWKGRVDQKECLRVKRISFKEDRELRLISTISNGSFTRYLNHPSKELNFLIGTIHKLPNPRIWKETFKKICSSRILAGKHINVNLNILIDEIVVSPFVPDYVFESVKTISQGLKLKNIIHSDLLELK
jgi:hypothetical protein